MIELSNNEMININGGSSFTISGTLLTGIYKSLNILMDVGRSFGTSLRMIRSGKICSI